MARLARSIVLGYPHHVSQRGNGNRTVFEVGDDYRYYLDLIRECSQRYAVEIWAYCLMSNHVHFICVPRAEEALARTFNTVHMRYAQYFNGKRAVRGHLWLGRFLSCVLDDASVHEEVRFIETNPVRAGIVDLAEAYPWSSARSHVAGESEPLLTGCFLQPIVPDWRAYLAIKGEEAVIRRVRERLRTGRPAGDISFVQRLEGILGRRLGALPRGRPKKMTKDARICRQ